MDGLVQLYGPFDLDSDHLPHFDIDGKPIEGDSQAQLNSRLKIVLSEGCCKRLGSGVASNVTPGRYIIIVFHCSIGFIEHQPYKVVYTFDDTMKIRELELGRTNMVEPGVGRTVNELYRVSEKNGLPLVTQNREMFRVDVATDDAQTQDQVRIAVLTYSSADILGQTFSRKSERYVTYTNAFWGGSRVTFSVDEDQVNVSRNDHS